MNLKELSFDTGLVTFSLNGAAELSFNPADAAFVEGIYNAFDALDKKQDEYKAEAEKAAGKREIFDVARKWDNEMRSMIDETLGTPVCESLFGEMNVYALNKDGLPVWAALMLTILDQVDGSFNERQQKTSAAISKYTSKYHR